MAILALRFAGAYCGQADNLEYERFQLIDSLAPYTDSGKVKCFLSTAQQREMAEQWDAWRAQKEFAINQFNQYVLPR